MVSRAFRYRDVHLSAFFGSDALNGFLATYDTSNLTLDPITATETDTTPWHSRPASGPYGRSTPSSFLRPPGRWMEPCGSLRPIDQPPTDQPPTGSVQYFDVGPAAGLGPHQVPPGHSTAPVQEDRPSTFIEDGLLPFATPQKSPVNSCICTSDEIFQSCPQFHQHQDEASNTGNLSGVCTCFAKYEFPWNYGIMVVARTCPIIVEHLKVMVSLISILRVVTKFYGS